MKHIEGVTLEKVIERLGAGDEEMRAKYGFEQRIAIMITLLHALEFAHRAGVLHRDLKPANVMLGTHGEVFLMDWGISRPMEGEPRWMGDDEAAESERYAPSAPPSHGRLVRTSAGAVVGTPLYMSPEQASGASAALDERSDVYSAGMLFMEWLCLSHPLDGLETVGAIVLELQTFVPPGSTHPIWVHPKQDAVPSELRHFLRRTVAPKPEDRWQSVREMIEELERIRAGRFRVQCGATFIKRVQHASGRLIDAFPVTATTLFVLGILAIVFGVASAALQLRALVQ